MLKIRALIAAIVLPLVLAGCLGEPDGSPGKGSGTAPTSTEATQPGFGEPPIDLPPFNSSASNRIEGTECIQGLTLIAAPAGTFGEKVPESWEENLDQTSTELHHYLFRCERLAWGQIERGPMFVLWETHKGAFGMPEACREEGFSHHIMATQILSDADAAAQARTFGMPTYLAEFEHTADDNAAARTWEWRWIPEGGEESTLFFQNTQPDVEGSFTAPYRFFWFNETAVSYADIEMVMTFDQVNYLSPVATGTMAAPMMYANAGLPAYVGNGDMSTQVSFSATIHQFRDFACEEPI